MPPCHVLALAALSLALSGPARAAPGESTISGKVLLVAQGNAVAIENVWVYVEHIDARPPATIGDAKGEKIVQRGRAFTPRILVIPIGTTVTFPIDDNDEHSVFSPSGGTWFGFEFGRYRKGVHKDTRFTDTGEFNIYCDLHEKMSAVVKVVRTTHFTAVPASGDFRLAVPPGRYRVWAWTPHSKEVRSELVEVKAGATAAVGELHVQRGTAPPTHPRLDGSAYRPY